MASYVFAVVETDVFGKATVTIDGSKYCDFATLNEALTWASENGWAITASHSRGQYGELVTVYLQCPIRG